MNNLNNSRSFEGWLFVAALLVASASSALAEVRYVDLNSASNAPPYTSWATAATNIQDAVDAALAGDEIVVTNGIFSVGARAAFGFTLNRVVLDKPLLLRSVNGPQFTIIDGGQSVRCLYLTNNANLSGFTLTNGLAGSNLFGDDGRGGGVRCASHSAVVSNCVITGNVARQSGSGGGAYGGTFNDCTLSGNYSQNSSVFCIRGCNAGGGGIGRFPCLDLAVVSSQQAECARSKGHCSSAPVPTIAF